MSILLHFFSIVNTPSKSTYQKNELIPFQNLLLKGYTTSKHSWVKKARMSITTRESSTVHSYSLELVPWAISYLNVIPPAWTQKKTVKQSNKEKPFVAINQKGKRLEHSYTLPHWPCSRNMCMKTYTPNLYSIISYKWRIKENIFWGKNRLLQCIILNILNSGYLTFGRILFKSEGFSATDTNFIFEVLQIILQS